MSDIDKRLDEILVKVASISIAADGNEYRACLLDAKQAIKQLMADEFEKMIGEVSKNFKPELIDMAHKEYHPEIAPGFTIGFNLAKELITDRVKKLEEWKK